VNFWYLVPVPGRYEVGLYLRDSVDGLGPRALGPASAQALFHSVVARQVFKLPCYIFHCRGSTVHCFKLQVLEYVQCTYEYLQM